jgi:protein O-mannosyl-transferase
VKNAPGDPSPQPEVAAPAARAGAPAWRRALPASAMCLGLAAVTLAAFWGVTSCGFVNFDDTIYITQNPRVLGGLTWDGVTWAWTTTFFGFYYPVTWLSHMLDVQLFGTNAGMHHLTSLVLHVLGTLILFLALLRMTRAYWRSALVACLFAIHPLHVESVAWLSERKDVLSALFWFLALLAYAFYAEKPSASRYLPVLASFLLGMLAKPMLITLPFVLLLLDYWPLGRWPSAAHPSRLAPPGEGPGRPAPVGRLVLEKLPLLALVPVFAVSTMLSQKEIEAVISADTLPVAQRVANALISCCIYMVKMFAPVGLTVFYPHPQKSVSYALAALCALALLAATAAALWLARRHKYLGVGWLWYLGMLVPVIGLVQVGSQAMADRYTYLPMVGLFILVVWGVADLAGAGRAARRAVSGIAGAALLGLLVLTRVQVGTWQTSRSLWAHALEVTSRNYMAHFYLAAALYDEGKVGEAFSHYEEALAILPHFAAAHGKMGSALADAGRSEEAIAHFEEALKIDPRLAEAHNGYGELLSSLGRVDEAIEQFDATVQLWPEDTRALGNLGAAYAKKGRVADAIPCFEKALQESPGNLDIQTTLGAALAQAGRTDEALAILNGVLAARPDSAEALQSLGQVLARSGRLPEAIDAYQKALRLKPDDAEAHEGLGVALDHSGRTSEAIEQFRQALRARPNYADASNNLGLALAKSGRLEEAVGCFRKAVEAKPDWADAWNNLGLGLAKTGRVSEAAECFRKAVELRPDFIQAQSNLGAAQEAAGRQGVGRDPGRRP